MKINITERMLGKNPNIRESLFRVIVFVGQTIAVFALIESLFLTKRTEVIWIQLSEIIVMGIAALAVFKYGKLNLGIFFSWIALAVIEFPFCFVYSGGTNGGAPIWFALGLFYVFMMFKGRTFGIILVFTLLIDTFVYVASYMGYLTILPIVTEQAVFMDSFFGVIGVGCTSGIIMRFQIVFYQKEKELVEKQNAELENATRAQNTFFASMSHEIRTPINSIIGLNEMIRRKAEDEQILSYADHVKQSSKVLLDLVNDILDYSQLEQQRMNIVNEDYSSADMFRSVIGMMQVAMEEKHLDFIVEIDPEIPLYLYGDQKRVEQILINLLNNAVKYTQEGMVRFCAIGQKQEDGRVKLTISVQDTGIGIRKENLDRLYDAFERVDSGQNHRTEGSGLGLSITKQLLNLMEGTISVDSIYTKGSIFTVSFLQSVIDDRTIGRTDFTNSYVRGASDYVPLFEAPEARILLVEDNRMNILVMRELLAETKVQLEIAENARECLEKTVDKYFDIILMDYLLPDMNGTEALKELRRQTNGLCKETPVILMTSNSASEARRLVNEFAFDSFLEKPIDVNRLEQELVQFLPDSVIEQQSQTASFEHAEPVIGHHMRRKPLCITSDSVSDIPDKLLEQLDIKVVPLYIRTDKGRFADSKEIDSDNLMQYLEDEDSFAIADSLSVEEYEQFYADCLAEAENVIHIAMAERVGRSYSVAVAAAAGFDHVRVISSGHISCGEGLLVIYAAQLARDGVSGDEICNRVNTLKQRVHTRFIMPNARIFYKNGYTSKFIANLCDVSGVHPVLCLAKNRVFIYGARMGNLETAWRKFIRFNLVNKSNIDTRIVYITYTNLTPQEQNFIREEIMKQIPFEQVIMEKASFSSSCNAGVETMGFAYFKKE